MDDSIFSGGFVVPAQYGGCDGGCDGGIYGGEMTKENKKKLLFAFMLAAIIVLIVYFVVKPAPKPPGVTPVIPGTSTFSSGATIAEQLAMTGWQVYTSNSCGYCTKQLSILGANDPNNAATISQLVNPCVSGNCTQGVPYWVNTTYAVSPRVGFQDISALNDMIAEGNRAAAISGYFKL